MHCWTNYSFLFCYKEKYRESSVADTNLFIGRPESDLTDADLDPYLEKIRVQILVFEIYDFPYMLKSPMHALICSTQREIIIAEEKHINITLNLFLMLRLDLQFLSGSRFKIRPLFKNADPGPRTKNCRSYQIHW